MATLTKEESKRGIRVSEMTPELQDQVEKLGIDQDGDGKITMKEVETLIESYLDTKKDNKFLRHLVTVLVIFSILLTGCVFGASITAARLSKDTAVDPVNGIMYAKGSETPIQTEAVAIRNDGVIVNDMNRKELDALHEINLDNGSMKFQVKGYAKSVRKNQVTLLVEGGSLIYGQEGLVAATGMAETMFNLVYPDDTVVSVEEGVRRTQRVLGQAKTNTVSGIESGGGDGGGGACGGICAVDWDNRNAGRHCAPGDMAYLCGGCDYCSCTPQGGEVDNNPGNVKLACCSGLREVNENGSIRCRGFEIDMVDSSCEYNSQCESVGLGNCYNKDTDEYLADDKNCPPKNACHCNLYN